MQFLPRPSQLDNLRAMRETIVTMTDAQIDAVALPLYGTVKGEYAWTKADLLRWYDDTIRVTQERAARL